jgi:hypothetical protein
MGKAPAKKKSFEEKIAEEMPEFVGEVVGLSVEQLKGRLGDIAKAQQENDDNQKADEELQQAKAHTKELNSTYTEPRKALKKKTKYLCGLVKEKGGA